MLSRANPSRGGDAKPGVSRADETAQPPASPCRPAHERGMGKTTEVRFNMPYVISGSRRTRRLLGAAALGLSLVCAAPAAAATTASNPLSCVPSGTFTQVFSAFSDTALYTPAPGGNIESPLTGWTLTGGAARVSGNEPFYVGRSSDRTSLSIPAGGSAVTAPMCIDQTYPFFRLFARNAGQLKSGLKVD